MVRTQIQLTERQTQRLKALAKERGVWMAELIRQNVDTLFDLPETYRLSLVDCTSFQAMRQLGIATVFAFDAHFAEQQFTCILQGTLT